MADAAIPVRRRRAQRKPEATAEAPDPLDIAIDAIRSGKEPKGAALKVLEKYAQLLDHQVASERLGLTLKLLTVGAGLAIAIGAGALVWSAASDRGLVVEPFQTPPGYASTGLNGVVLASKVMDRIAVLDSQSQSLRASDTYENSWGHDLKVEIAETGVSIADVQRFLRQWLGHETRISGELVQVGDRLQLTVRSGGRTATTVEGKPGELDALITKAAETVYDRTQPYQYSKYLEYQGRLDESMQVARRLTREGSGREKGWAWAQVCNLLANAGSEDAALEACERGLKIASDNILVLINKASAEQILGHDQAAMDWSDRIVARSRAAARQLSVGGRNQLIGFKELSAQFRGDYLGGAEVLLPAIESETIQGSDLTFPVARAWLLAAGHDAAAAERAAQGLPDLPLGFLLQHWGGWIDPWAEMAEARGDWAGALARLDAAVARADPNARIDSYAVERFIRPMQVSNLLRLGRLAEARALAEPLPRDCFACTLARAEVAEASGDRAGADQAYREAVRQAPRMPLPYLRWGQALLARGDGKGALDLARRAERLGPRFADAHVLEGDALVRLGQPRTAVARYRQGVKLTPAWGGAWARLAEAQARLGQGGEAAESARTARRLVLRPDEAQRLARLRL